ncbi:MAG: hypothetical protein RL398_1732 [Planctomycetota bacterium]|jgi:4'-phosphopantetheinyl transferase
MDDIALHADFAPRGLQPLDLGPSDLHVWAVPLTGEPDSGPGVLSPAELQRVDRFRFVDHRRRFQIGHSALRRILACYLGVDPRAIEFTQGARGKPYLASAGPYFNLSHSGKLALIAVSRSEVGVDLEKVRRLDSLTEIARRHFAAPEFATLESLQGAERELAFYRCWTRKEAYIKALGEGLSLSLDSFEVGLGADPEFVACHDGRENPAQWSLLDVSPGPDFVAAAALRGRGLRLQTFALRV